MVIDNDAGRFVHDDEDPMMMMMMMMMMVAVAMNSGMGGASAGREYCSD